MLLLLSVVCWRVQCVECSHCFRFSVYCRCVGCCVAGFSVIICCVNDCVGCACMFTVMCMNDLQLCCVVAKILRFLSFPRHGVGFECVTVVHLSFSMFFQLFEQLLVLLLRSVVCRRAIVCTLRRML